MGNEKSKNKPNNLNQKEGENDYEQKHSNPRDARNFSIEITPDLFIKDYAGLWYQVASTPFFYNLGCSGSIAVYDLPDFDKKEFRVRNFCLKSENAKPNYAIGKALLLSCDHANLLVEFPQVPQFVIGKEKRQGGNYFVIEYVSGSYSVVVTRNFSVLWILARDINFRNSLKCQELIEKYQNDPRLKAKLKLFDQISNETSDKVVTFLEESNKK